MWHSSSSGRIELNITKSQAASAAHQGQCDEDVLALSKVPKIARQLKLIDPVILADELREFGAWSNEDLTDHEQNLQRYLWTACCDVHEGR